MSSLVTDLELVTGLAAADLEPLLRITDPNELEAAMNDILPGYMDQWSLAASAVAAEWYDAEREREQVAGTFAAIVAPLGELGVSALIGWAVEPLRSAEPNFEMAKNRLVGGTQKRLANSANVTITGSTVADPKARGWTRHTRSDACDFCKMVASRGAVFTAKTATFACHEHCFCRAVPVWEGRSAKVRSVRVDKYKQSERFAKNAPGSLEHWHAKEFPNTRAREWIKKNLT